MTNNDVIFSLRTVTLHDSVIINDTINELVVALIVIMLYNEVYESPCVGNSANLSALCFNP